MTRDPSYRTIRAAAHLSIGFVLDLVKLTGFGRDVIDGLLLAAISQANVDQITRDSGLQRAYATLDRPPPDELRRPVSISAIANSLRLPFETTRRRVAGLVELGAVHASSRGVIIPTAPLNSPFYRMAVTANYNLVKTLYIRLRGIGLLDDMPRPSGPPHDPENPPVRLVIRLSSGYLLRIAERFGRQVGDPVAALLLLDLVQANTEHLNHDGHDEAYGDLSPAGFISDVHRKPATVATLATRLGMAPETVRRRLARLAAEDKCEKVDGGFIVPARILALSPFVQDMADNPSQLYRLYASMAEFGILAEWESEVLRLRGAA